MCSVRYVGQTLGNRYVPGSGRIWLDEVNCTGTETHIFNCLHRGWGLHDCGHHEDVSIRCNKGIVSRGQKRYPCFNYAVNVHRSMLTIAITSPRDTRVHLPVTYFQFHGTTFHLVLLLFASQLPKYVIPYRLTFCSLKHSLHLDVI